MLPELPNDELPDDLMPLADVPARWPAVISRRHARRMREERAVRGWVVGHRFLVSESDIRAYITSRERPARHRARAA